MNIRRCATQLLLIAALALNHAAHATDRPNVLFLFADDQRPDTVGAFGNDVIQTPHIDSLVNGGFRFERAYCLGSTGGAVCVPSRAMVNSGRSLYRINNQLKDIPTAGQTFGEQGYVTFGTGKWHNGAESFLRSFQQGKAVFLGGMNDHTKVPLVDVTNGETTNKRIGDGFSSTLFADAAVEFLKTRNGEKPFYAYVAFTASHDPRQFPDEVAEMYPPDEMPLPTNYLPQHPFFNGWMTGRDEALAPWPRTKTIIRHQLADYYRLISHMDQQIGRILQALNESGHAENTIIVYSADHGLAVGSHGLLGKQSVYEHSMGTPLVFKGPGIPAGKSSPAFAYLFDIFPTLCEVTGVTPPEGVEGQSLAPIWRGKSHSVRSRVFLAYENYMRSIRTDRWKLIRYPHINRTQLFDLTNDPHELTDLANDHRQAQRVANLFAQLEQAQVDYADTLPLTSENPVDAHIDLTGQERKPDQHQPAWIVKKYFDLEGWNWKDE
ncbi:MAG: sulfatase-like hydrolase/transferase [Planctomycetaceae bacterium]|nr:sulfatase-like hydrolase/transferase [Planctomycetaceae bacterium]